MFYSIIVTSSVLRQKFASNRSIKAGETVGRVFKACSCIERAVRPETYKSEFRVEDFLIMRIHKQSRKMKSYFPSGYAEGKGIEREREKERARELVGGRSELLMR